MTPQLVCYNICRQLGMFLFPMFISTNYSGKGILVVIIVFSHECIYEMNFSFLVLKLTQHLTLLCFPWDTDIPFLSKLLSLSHFQISPILDETTFEDTKIVFRNSWKMINDY